MVDERKRGFNPFDLKQLSGLIVTVGVIVSAISFFVLDHNKIYANEEAIASTDTKFDAHIKEDGQYKQAIAGELGGIKASLQSQSAAMERIANVLERRQNGGN